MNGNVREARGWIFDGITEAPSVCLLIHRDQRDYKKLKVNTVFFWFCFFQTSIFRPKNWHPIRQPSLTCVRWELLNYFKGLQHGIKTVFWLTELGLDWANFVTVRRHIICSVPAIVSDSVKSLFWVKCCLRLDFFWQESSPAANVFCRKKC